MRVFPMIVGAVFFSALTAGGAPPAGATPKMGINLAAPADWGTELPFVDVFRTSRAWISQRDGAGWGQGPELAVDELGWVKRLEPGCYAETMLCTITGGHYPGGVYTVLYDGAGRLDFGGSVRIVRQAPGGVQINVDSSREGFSLRIRETDASNYVRNIRVIMPGFEKTWQKEPFHPLFLARWRGVACFRFMDWMETNGSKVTRWADRPTPAHATFAGRGVALEWMIELCNRQRADAWFCMPHQADDEYVRQFATMVKAKLAPGLKVYVEYSNEVWNSQFPQHKYAGEQGVRLGMGDAAKPWEAAWHYTAARSVEIFAIWEKVLGGRQRLVRVLPSQAANPWIAGEVLGFRDAARHADVLAIAPYMGFNVGQEELAAVAAEMPEWKVDKVIEHFEKTALLPALESMKKNKEVADKFGVKLVAYEGGQHMVALVGDETAKKKISALMHAANRSPRMGELYRIYYGEWQRVGGDLFVPYASVGEYTVHGAWGLAEYADSKAADSPKLKATLQAAKAWGQKVNEGK